MTTSTDSVATGVQTPALVVGTAFSLGLMSEGRIMALAAACPSTSTDPVDIATTEALEANFPGVEVPEVHPDDVDPATRNRRYSLVRVHASLTGVDAPQDLVVMRGDLDTVLTKVTIGRDERGVLKRNANLVIRRGWRPLAVAVATVDENGTVGPFKMEGFIPVCPETVARQSATDVSTGPAVWARVRLWSASLRIQHWSNVALVFILSCTGFYIMDPFFGPSAFVGEQTGFLMGWVRLIHFTAAFVWLVVALTRIWSAFTSRDRHLRWPAMWPLKKKEDIRNLGRVLQHYVFIKEEAPLFLGHNPLQQLTYLAVYIVCGIQMMIGFMLYGLYHQSFAFWAFFSTPVHWIGVPAMRLIHTLVMFALWMFVIAHIYLVLRAESLERHGGLSSMINGGVWVKRGSRPVDAPAVE
ncbi:MAG: Ni/Fe-hydrogenase, b-type cytochrome subunit [Propionibacteriaceae bacterium]|nr:Ni/Fe-hydrogenase, b-type cytochrome subunit [Propionibacteriaceae bacterium]